MNWLECERCPISQYSATRVLTEFSPTFSQGIVFMGIAPGPSEGTLGRPFIGYSGRAFRQMLRDLNISNYAITNMVACVPRDSYNESYRDPTPTEITNCEERLTTLLSTHKPSALILMGKLTHRYAYTGDLPTLKISHPRTWVPPNSLNVEYKHACDTISKFLKGLIPNART